MNDTPWPQTLAERLLAWARQLQPALGEAIASCLQRCAEELESARSEGHVLIELGAVDAARLLASGVVEDAAEPGFPRGLPLVLDGRRLYLHRDHEHERSLAARLAGLLQAAPQAIAEQPLRSLFPAGPELDWQALAVAQALRQRLTLISGGPGTGKTSTVLRLLACLLAAEPQARVQLAAPTGKAAQRMLEALRAGLPGLQPALGEQLAGRLPEQAQTLHRLLGADGRGGYRRGRGAGQQRLELDCLIVDEASMLDLALARQLLDALPEGARLVLLGDRHQLAAVENGAVFAELSEAPGWSEATQEALRQALDLATLPAQPAPLPDLAIQFRRSHRFASDSGIGRLASSLREGDAEAALQLLREGRADLQWLGEGGADWLPALEQGMQPYVQALLALQARPGDTGLEQALWTAWDGFRLLCAGHAGPWGSRALNARAAQWLQTQLPAEAEPGLGQALLVTRNDAARELLNGDILLLLPAADGRLQAQLRRSDAEPRRLALQALPEELAGAFALTVHKAQGSEFERALLLLPDAQDWAGREWLYTGATRARSRLQLLASEAALRATIARPTARRSGLRDALRRQQALA